MPIQRVRTRVISDSLSNQCIEFIVNGTAIPDVDFDIGESYAGNIEIPARNDNSSLYFWYFPTANPAGKDDITIWLNVRYP